MKRLKIILKQINAWINVTALFIRDVLPILKHFFKNVKELIKSEEFEALEKLIEREKEDASIIKEKQN